jgi:hypothetical protein
MKEQESVQSALSYAVGGGAIASPWWMDMLHQATDILQFMTVLTGFVIVILRLRHDWKKSRRK